MTLSGRIFKNKACDLVLLSMLTSNFRRSITFFNIILDASFSGRHAPRFSINLIILNVILFEFSFYDTRHKD
jgi:hypothetical protein